MNQDGVCINCNNVNKPVLHNLNKKKSGSTHHQSTQHYVKH